MAIEGIYAAVSGLRAAERRVGQTAHNLANVSTPGFMPRRMDQAEVAGGGVQISGSTPLTPGPIIPSERPLDLAINGGGFFVLDDGNGGQVYSRVGNFQLEAPGRLVDGQGRQVLPAFTLPAQTASVRVTPQGQVQALASDGSLLAQGQLQTAVFGNPGGLEPVGGNAYRATGASGPPAVAAPGTPGHGEIVAGAMQASGTDIASSMVDLIIDQRAFEANLKTIKTQDDMLGSILDVLA
ncbi:MAG: flagellar hook-basal body complex protein [Desulfarculus sp.]|nr:flagellar hook-basal body complex protein [Desulfarculus sp.]